MSRLSLAAVLGFAAAALLALGTGRAQESRSQPKAHDHAQHFLDCAKACDDCARICEACGSHCTRLVADGKKEHLETVRTCHDCATVCAAASAITARTGPYSDAICQACADVCKRCGDACEKQATDPMMKQCAAECRKCEKACRDMLAHARPQPASR
ncbi:MAG: four-helix bundle copper-binding protein [Gemmataceae bacterium]